MPSSRWAKAPGAYLRKAAREAKRRTSWRDPDPEYEGVLDVEESAIAELCALTAELIDEVGKLVKPQKPKT